MDEEEAPVIKDLEEEPEEVEKEVPVVTDREEPEEVAEEVPVVRDREEPKEIVEEESLEIPQVLVMCVCAGVVCRCGVLVCVQVGVGRCV